MSLAQKQWRDNHMIKPRPSYPFGWKYPESKCGDKGGGFIPSPDRPMNGGREIL